MKPVKPLFKALPGQHLVNTETLVTKRFCAWLLQKLITVWEKVFMIFVRFSSSNYTFVCFLVENKHVGVVCRSLTPTSLRGGVVSSWMRTKLSRFFQSFVVWKKVFWLLVLLVYTLRTKNAKHQKRSTSESGKKERKSGQEFLSIYVTQVFAQSCI